MRPVKTAVVVCGLVAIVVCASWVSSASAATIRHDVPDSKYLKLGSRFKNVGLVSGGVMIDDDLEYLYSGSGVLINKEWIITAAHIVNPLESDPDWLTVTFGNKTYTADRWVYHPEWDWDPLAGKDVGLFHLTEKVERIKPAKLYRGQDELGQEVKLAGYGASGTGETGVTFSDGQKRGGTNRIDAIYRENVETPSVLMMDFDNPDDPRDSYWAPVEPTSLESLPSFGDSGGGLFIGSQLAGVASFGWAPLDGWPDSDYGDTAGYTRLSVHLDWIEGVISDAGSDGDGDSDGGRPPKSKGPKRGLQTSYDFSFAPIPEPATMALLALGALALVRRRR